jgi:hypothetical protein
MLRRIRALVTHVNGVATLILALLALGAVACGGGSSEAAEVGDCIDAESNVVDCDSSSATHELVSDQSEPDAIACVLIGDQPQEEVEVGDKTFCAEER